MMTFAKSFAYVWGNLEFVLWVDVNDMDDILNASPDIIVIGTGYAENMRVSEDLTSETRQHDTKLVAENT